MSKMPRVLVVLPFYGGSLPVGRYCADALKENGCLVDVFEAPKFFPAFSELKGLKVRQERLDYLENSFLRVVGEAVLAQVERFRPDLVLAMAQAPLPRPILQRLKKDGVTTAMWFVEDYRLFIYWRAFAQYYDFFAVIQREPFLSELRGIGVENALYLPMAAQPSVHRPLGLTSTEVRHFGSELSFMGAGYPNRREAFKQLSGYAFKIWGTEWEGEPALEKLVQMQGQRISSEDSVRIFNASKINLNLHSGMQASVHVSGGDFVNPRTFEVASCGAFQLVDRRTLMPELFAEDELATFGSMQELKEKVDYFLAHDQERAGYSARGQARVLAEHSYAARMKTLLDFVRERAPGWPPSASQTEIPAVLAEMPEDLRGELVELLGRLELPTDTDFDTLIAALRQRSDVLSPVESALLFLDQWKKQYSSVAG